MAPFDVPPLRDDPTAVSDVLRAIANRRRRLALQCLSEGRVSSVAALAVDVDGLERETLDDESPAIGVEVVALELHHQHLPKLAWAELAVYDPGNDVVSITSAGQSVADWLGDGSLAPAASPQPASSAPSSRDRFASAVAESSGTYPTSLTRSVSTTPR